jgi:hypothetical protein
LIKGWQICGMETLEMHVVEEKDCPLHGTFPGPRVLQNQLDHLLERQIYETEYSLLGRLQELMVKKKRPDWVAIFLTLVIMLHVFERDTWRLMYWILHPEEVNFL